MNLLEKFFGKPVNLKDVVAKGGVVVDVRTKAEYQQGHLKSSVNIPLDVLQKNVSALDKNKPVITCCASGIRSASAKSILVSQGFTEVYNGGSWTSLKKLFTA